MSRLKKMFPSLWLISICFLASPVWAQSTNSTVWIDWTNKSSNQVTGSVPGSQVTATLTAVSSTAEDLSLSTIDGTFDWVAAWFTPNLPNSDAIWISNSVENSNDLWRIQFSQPVTDPYFHFRGMERTYSFNSNIELVSAGSGFVVVGSTIEGIRGCGAGEPKSGTLRMPGTFTEITIRGSGIAGCGHNRDAINLQVGVLAPITTAVVPFVADDLNSDEPFSSRLFTAPPGVSPIGVVAALTGRGTIQRLDGTIEPMTAGTPIFFGDVVETDPGAQADLIFVDESEFSVSEKARFKIDEYIYDDSPSTDAGFSLLRGLFVFIDDLIGSNKPTDLPEVRGPGGGIRGDAGDILSRELLANPDSNLYGNAGIWVENASPAGVSTVVELPDGKLDLDVDFIFLGEQEGQLSILLGETVLLSQPLLPARRGETQHAQISVEGLPSSLGKLTFLVDGPAGNSLILTGLVLPGRSLLSFDNWFKEGDGLAQFVLLTTTDQLGLLLHDAATARIAKLCPCGRAWKNHGEYVSCTTKAAKQFVDLGLISGVEKDAIVSAAGQSQCGHKK